MADNYLQTQQDLINHLNNNLPNGFTVSDIAYPNGNTSFANNQKWLRVTFNEEPKQNVSAGGVGQAYKRQFAIMTIDVFYPVGQGNQQQLININELIASFENQAIGNANCINASPNTIGADGSWYNTQLDISFYYQGATA